MTNLAPAHAEIAEDLDKAWHDVVAAGAFILGNWVERFQEEWSTFCGTAEAVGVANGTEAIELALRALGIGPGDEVIVPAMTFIATGAAVVATGATPVFCDVEERSLLLTPEAVSAALTPQTRAVIAVHLYGTVVDIDAIRAVVAGRGISIIEDAAQAHGACWGDRMVGSLGDIAAFSHYPTKNLGAFGDGGSVTTDDPQLAHRIRLLGNHGRASQSDQEYHVVGRTGRLDGLQAAVLSVKLRRLDGWNESRRSIVGWYDELLPAATTRIAGNRPSEAAPHLCVVRVPERDRVREALRLAGIGTGVHYADPVPRTLAFGARRDEFPVAEQAADSIVSLPLWPGLERSDVEHVCASLRASL